MTTTAIWVTIFASLISSGLLGALISTIVHVRREKRKFKVDTLKRLAANRYDLKGDEFSRALNEIFVVFNDSPKVMKALSEFHQAIVSKQVEEVSSDALMRLFKAMCEDARIEYNHFNDSFFMIPFNTSGTGVA